MLQTSYLNFWQNHCTIFCKEDINKGRMLAYNHMNVDFNDVWLTSIFCAVCLWFIFKQPWVSAGCITLAIPVSLYNIKRRFKIMNKGEQQMLEQMRFEAKDILSDEKESKELIEFLTFYIQTKMPSKELDLIEIKRYLDKKDLNNEMLDLFVDLNEQVIAYIKKYECDNFIKDTGPTSLLFGRKSRYMGKYWDIA